MLLFCVCVFVFLLISTFINNESTMKCLSIFHFLFFISNRIIFFFFCLFFDVLFCFFFVPFLHFLSVSFSGLPKEKPIIHTIGNNDTSYYRPGDLSKFFCGQFCSFFLLMLFSFTRWQQQTNSKSKNELILYFVIFSHSN